MVKRRCADAKGIKRAVTRKRLRRRCFGELGDGFYFAVTKATAAGAAAWVLTRGSRQSSQDIAAWTSRRARRLDGRLGAPTAVFAKFTSVFKSLNVATQKGRPKLTLMTKFTVPLFVAIPVALSVGVGSVLWTDNSRIVFLLALVGVWVVWLMSDDGFHFPGLRHRGAEEIFAARVSHVPVVVDDAASGGPPGAGSRRRAIGARSSSSRPSERSVRSTRTFECSRYGSS